MAETIQRRIDQPPEKVLRAIQEAAEMWGAVWHRESGGGRLGLPVVQGLRHGVVEGRLETGAVDGGTELSLEIQDHHYTVNRSAVAVLTLGALGGLSVVLWPLSPKLLQLAPIGAVLALVAWLLVVSRLRNSGVDDFFDLVADLTEHP